MSLFISFVQESTLNNSQPQNASPDSSPPSHNTPSLSVPSEDDSLSGWDRAEGAAWSAASDAFFMGPCPHTWLFKQVDAVVHHGGAGEQISVSYV